MHNLLRRLPSRQEFWEHRFQAAGQSSWVLLCAVDVVTLSARGSSVKGPTMTEVEFVQVETPAQKAEAGGLIREYLDWLNQRLTRDYGMSFDAEAMVQSDLSDPHKFHPPHGRFYLATHDANTAGVGCLKKLDNDIGEVQRMYVLPAYRGQGIGRAIANRLVQDARSIGYRQLRLESLEFLEAAHALYRSMGFRQINPYEDNSMESYQDPEQLDAYYRITVFMEMDL